MKLDKFTDGELSILQVLWDRGEATSREITAALYSEVTDPKTSSSVQKLIERLEAKAGRRARSAASGPIGFARWSPTHEQYLHSRLQALADRSGDGHRDPLGDHPVAVAGAVGGASGRSFANWIAVNFVAVEPDRKGVCDSDLQGSHEQLLRGRGELVPGGCCAGLAGVVSLLGRFWKNPAGLHLLWVLVPRAGSPPRRC